MSDYKKAKKEMKELIIKVGGVHNILNLHLRPLIDKYGMLNTQNAMDYFSYSDQGKNQIQKALA